MGLYEEYIRGAVCGVRPLMEVGGWGCVGTLAGLGSGEYRREDLRCV